MRSPASRTAPSAQCWDRDEWDVALSDGTYRLFRERDTDHWFVEGIVEPIARGAHWIDRGFDPNNPPAATAPVDADGAPAATRAQGRRLLAHRR